MQKILKIALPIPFSKPFSYLPGNIENIENIIGSRALVPFGSRIMTGYIVGISEEIPEYKLKNIIELLDTKPVFNATMLNFTKWISTYYMAGLGDTMKAALPQGMSPKSMLKINIVKEIKDSDIELMKKTAPKRAELLKELAARISSVSIGYLEKKLNSPNITAQIEALTKLGYIETEKLVEKETTPKTVKAIKISQTLENNKETLKNIFDELDQKAPKQAALLGTLLLKPKDKIYILADIIKETKCSHQTANALAAKNIVDIYETDVARTSLDIGEKLAKNDESKYILTEEQTDAARKITGAIDNEVHAVFLLHGVTGSGKTLVYIKAIKKALELGKSVLFLVPEITLTPQLIDRFEIVFPGQIAVLHSRQSEGERYDAWKAAYEGKAKIMMGVRSAIFTPFENPGLIIVDEEHDSSFKQDNPQPRYNARDAAVVRANLEKAVLVLGSATPSIESMHNSKAGKYQLLKIMKRADNAAMPDIKAIDIFDAQKQNQLFGAFTKELIEQIAEKVRKKEGVILLQNRRGFSAMQVCTNCGHIPMCKYCDISMTFHKFSRQLKCHYCGYVIPSSNSCEICGHPDMNIIGTGTQRIEEELSELLSAEGVKAVIERMDLDTTSRKGSHRKILSRFAKGETNILLGTQMVAKGLDFPHVTLVAVVNADLQLFMPDFRAAERTYQLLTQVAGRAGRNVKLPGQVLIQTSKPGNPAITSVKRNSYEMFYYDEIENRKNANYPPYVRFNLIEFSGKKLNQVEEHAAFFKNLFPEKSKYIEVIGPSEPFIGRLRSKYRRVIFIKNNKQNDPGGAKLRAFIKAALDEYKKDLSTSSVKIKIDIDSYSVL